MLFQLSEKEKKVNNIAMLIKNLFIACVYRVMDAHRRFGEHDKFLRVARGAADSNSSFLSAFQTSQVHP